MSGHSHWATIKHKKGAIDAKRGKLFSKLSRAIIIAARHGGGDPDANLKLRYAIDKAREVSMPKDNIERAIKRGTGETEGLTFEEIQYEGYGPGGVAILVDILTDNRNRISGEIRKIFDRAGGKMGSAGCVSYMFERKGVFTVDTKTIEEDALAIVWMPCRRYEACGQRLRNYFGRNGLQPGASSSAKAGLTLLVAEIMQVAKVPVEVDMETGKKVVRLMDTLTIMKMCNTSIRTLMFRRDGDECRQLIFARD